MAKYINGEFSGRVRDMVFRRTKEFGVVVSEYNEGSYRNRKWSEGQSFARQRFSFLSKMSGVFRQSSNLGFGLGKKVLSHPMFIKYNYGVVVDDGNGGVRVDEGLLCVSQGSLGRLEGLEAVGGGSVVELRWGYVARRGGLAKGSRVRAGSVVDRSGDDRVVVVIYCPEVGEGWCKNQCVVRDGVARRRDCVARVGVPSEFVGKGCFVYVFVVDDECRSSDSQFVGEFVFGGETGDGVDGLCVSGVDEREDEGVVFVGVERRDEVRDGEVKRCFVMRFEVDDDEVEDVLEEPVSDEDFRCEYVDGKPIGSRAERAVRKMARLIRLVNLVPYGRVGEVLGLWRIGGDLSVPMIGYSHLRMGVQRR